MSAQERIAEVLRAHKPCHERCVVQGKTHCAGCNHWVPDFEDHAAAAVLAALCTDEPCTNRDHWELR